MLDVDPDGAGDLATEGGHVETDPARSVLSRKTLNLDLNPTLPGAIGYSNPTLDKLIQNRICGRFRFDHPLKPVWINGQDIAVPGKGTAESPSRVPEFARQLLALGKSRKARVITQDLAHPSEKRLGRLVSREDRATSYAINPPDRWLPPVRPRDDPLRPASRASEPERHVGHVQVIGQRIDVDRRPRAGSPRTACDPMVPSVMGSIARSRTPSALMRSADVCAGKHTRRGNRAYAHAATTQAKAGLQGGGEHVTQPEWPEGEDCPARCTD